jgi:hypothetical protein
MDFEYKGTGSIKTTVSFEIIIKLNFISHLLNINFISINPVVNSIIHTNRFSLLSDGSMATNGFNDVKIYNLILKGRAA